MKPMTTAASCLAMLLGTAAMATALPHGATVATVESAEPAASVVEAHAAVESGLSLYYNTAQTCGEEWVSEGTVEYDRLFLFSAGCKSSYAPLTDSTPIPAAAKATGKPVYLVIGSGDKGFSEADLTGLAKRAAADGYAGVQLEIEAGCEGCTDTADFLRILAAFIEDAHAAGIKAGLTTGGSGNTMELMCGVPGICSVGCVNTQCPTALNRTQQEALLTGLAGLDWDHWTPQTYAWNMCPAPAFGWYTYWSSFRGDLLPAIGDNSHTDFATLETAYQATDSGKELKADGLVAAGLVAFPWTGTC